MFLSWRGASISVDISTFCLMLFEFGYIYYKKLYVNTWNGWSTDCLYEWRIYLKLAIPGLFGLVIEWSNFEIGTLLSGILNYSLSKMHLTSNLFNFPKNIQSNNWWHWIGFNVYSSAIFIHVFSSKQSEDFVFYFNCFY